MFEGCRRNVPMLLSTGKGLKETQDDGEKHDLEAVKQWQLVASKILLWPFQEEEEKRHSSLMKCLQTVLDMKPHLPTNSTDILREQPSRPGPRSHLENSCPRLPTPTMELGSTSRGTSLFQLRQNHNSYGYYPVLWRQKISLTSFQKYQNQRHKTTKKISDNLILNYQNIRNKYSTMVPK